MKRKFATILPWIITALVIAAAFIPQLRAQTQTFELHPGDSLTFDIFCRQAATETPTLTNTPEPAPSNTPTLSPTNTSTPEPTESPTPPPPTPTATSEPSIWTGFMRGITDYAELRQAVGGQIVDLPISDWPSAPGKLDDAHANGYAVVVNLYDRNTVSKRPWEWDGHEWLFPQEALDVLADIADHPALLAVYALHEPFENYTVEQQKELYQLLKDYTDGAPVWSDVGGLAHHDDLPLSDGICDYCGTFRHYFRTDWTSQQCLNEILGRIDADLDTQQQLMPNSQIVFQIQTWAGGSTFTRRMPSVAELETVRNHLCALGQPMAYYTWSRRSYDNDLKRSPELWPAARAGCDTIPTPEPTATGTAQPTATNTPTPTPTSTPASSGGIIIDHTYADTVPDLAFLDGREAVFSGKSWRDRIMPQVLNYTSAVDGVNAGSCSYDYPCKIANFKNQIQGYWAGVVKACYSDIFYVTDPEALAQYYIAEMDTVSQKTILTTFVLTSAAYGRSGENAKSQIYNDYLRTHCLNTPGCVLWDIADIISDGGACSENGYQVMCPAYDEGDHKHPNTTGANRLARGLLWAFSKID